MGVRAVLFDIGGVLETTPSTGWADRWSERLGIGADQLFRRLEATWEAGDIGAVTLEQVEVEIAEALELDDEGVRAFMEDQWEEYLGTLNEPLAEFFAGLRPRYRTGILSNSFVGAREREQGAYDFASMCDLLVYSHEEGMKKPEAALYLLACERLGVAPSEVVFLDDRPENVEGAEAVGMRAVQFRRTEQAIADIEAHLRDRRASLT